MAPPPSNAAEIEAECVDWEQPPAVAAPSGAAPAEPSERTSTCVAIATLILSIPALVGSWCWPLLLAGLFSGLTNLNTSATRSFSHSVTWGINLAVFSNMLQFVFNKTKRTRKGMSFGRKWGPFNCILLALFLIMADLTRHLVNDAWGTACTELDRDNSPHSLLGIEDTTGGAWQALPDKFTKYCYSRNVANEFAGADEHLSVYGWVFTIICTWSGFAMLFVGICWALQLPAKVAAQWRQIRGTRARGVAPAQGAAGGGLTAGGRSDRLIGADAA